MGQVSDIEPILDASRLWRGAPMALATVISTWGSAPRPRGSHMLVHADGRLEGSISGGCIEGEVLALAADVIGGAPAQRRTFGVSDGMAWEAGLPCGGSIEIFVQPVADHGFAPHLFDAVREARAAGETIAVATHLESGQSRLADVAEEGHFLNHYAPPRRLFIVGAVQIAQTLVSIARSIDIRPIVIDPRARFLTEARFPGTELDDRWPDEAIAAWKPDKASAIVTLSHDPKIDDPALIAALAAPTGYVAALGSRRSHAARRERLAAAGLDTATIDRIEGPAGIDIGALGTAEIALSVAAGLVRALGQRKG
ncbi:XdhC family protein [Sphingomonas sp.]|uniref:XdhC family protein n=1 Tax=Sphingomonas sp. TaxID=28214 RepID=UPI000DB5D282|nr:XdhC family protein [Sphingomonas sp.]PZU08754.1 MAG: XshC-Cox1-family protein [Sphingomonas sp.]